MDAVKTQPAVIEKQASETKRKATKGAAQMRAAADIFLEQDCLEIASALSEKSTEGYIQSARFLYTLAETDEQSSQDTAEDTSYSIAREWANSPEWNGDSTLEERSEDDENANDS